MDFFRQKKTYCLIQSIDDILNSTRFLTLSMVVFISKKFLYQS